MSLDCTLSSAFDRKPMTFSAADSLVLSGNLVSAADSSKEDPIHTLHILKLNWHAISTQNMCPSRLRPQIVQDFLATARNIESQIERDRSERTGANVIQQKIEQLAFTIRHSFFKADILRCSSLSRATPPQLRQQHWEDMKAHLHEVIQGFLKLKRVASMAIISWTLLYYTITSGLVLTGVDAALGATESHQLVRKLIGSLASAEGSDVEVVSCSLATAPYSHSLNALRHILSSRDGS